MPDKSEDVENLLGSETTIMLDKATSGWENVTKWSNFHFDPISEGWVYIRSEKLYYIVIYT